LFSFPISAGIGPLRLFCDMILHQQQQIEMKSKLEQQTASAFTSTNFK